MIKQKLLEEIKKEVDVKLKNGHPGNLQIRISDKCLLHYAEIYSSEDGYTVDVMLFSFDFYGENIQAQLEIDKDNKYISIGYAEGQLLDEFDNFIDDVETYPILSYIWEAVENWTLK